MIKQEKTIALFGGAFDPPHKGHLSMIDNLISLDFIHQVWILPCGDRNDKKLLFSFEERLKLISKCIEKYGNNHRVIVKATDEQIKLCKQQQRVVPKVELFKHFRQKYEGYSFYFVIGSDVLQTFHMWDQPETLFSENKFIIYQRKGSEIQINNSHDHFLSNKKYFFPKSYFINDYTPPEISSTFVKQTIFNSFLSHEEKRKILENILDEPTFDFLKMKNWI